MLGLADLIATAGLATDDPYEGSGPVRSGPGPRCSTWMGAVAGLLHLGTVAGGLLPAVLPELEVSDSAEER